MNTSPRLSAKALKVLSLLLEKPQVGRSGAEISRAISIGSGTLYPMLARLEMAGWLTSEWEIIDPAEAGRPRQRFYKLTGLGQSNALHALAEIHIPQGAFAWSR
jgi:DNA-binding PadR family transcriptional regulator